MKTTYKSSIVLFFLQNIPFTRDKKNLLHMEAGDDKCILEQTKNKILLFPLPTEQMTKVPFRLFSQITPGPSVGRRVANVASPKKRTMKYKTCTNRGNWFELMKYF